MARALGLSSDLLTTDRAGEAPVRSPVDELAGGCLVRGPSVAQDRRRHTVAPRRVAHRQPVPGNPVAWRPFRRDAELCSQRQKTAVAILVLRTALMPPAAPSRTGTPFAHVVGRRGLLARRSLAGSGLCAGRPAARRVVVVRPGGLWILGPLLAGGLAGHRRGVVLHAGAWGHSPCP